MKRLFGKDAVLDNNVVVDFCELGRPDIIFAVFGNLYIAKDAYDREMFNSVKGALSEFTHTLAQVNSAEGYEIYFTLSESEKYQRLSRFDKLAIAIAGQGKCFCTSNDGLMRKACEEFAIDYTGTLGILGCAYESGVITKSEFETLLNKLTEETSCFITKRVVEQFLEDNEY